MREDGQERGKNGRDGSLCVQKVSVSTGPARGNTVDGLPLFEVLAQNLEYLAALWSDFAEKLPIWSFLHADSEFEDERSGKIL